MQKRIKSLAQQLQPIDGLSLVVLVVGLMIAIFLPDIAIKLIGSMVAVLGVLAFIIGFSTRYNNMIESIKPSKGNPTPGISVTEIVNQDGIQSIIDGYADNFGPSVSEQESKPEKPKVFSLGDEGFTIICPKPETQKVDSGNNDTFEEPVKQANSTSKIHEKDEKAQSGISVTAPTYENNSNEVLETVFETEEHIEEKPQEERIDNKGEKEIDSGAIPGSENITSDKPSESKKQNEKSNKTDVNKNKIVSNENQTKIPLDLLVDDISGKYTNQPRKEFEYFLSRSLLTIHSALETRTVAFILLNNDKKQMILESFATDIPDHVTKSKILPLGSDIISRIMNNKAPELLSEINQSAELDLIPYYTKPSGTSSFIGVPVFFGNSVIGVLCADSAFSDSYDKITIGFLGNFTKLISALVISYTEKYNLLLAAKTLGAINRFRSLMYDKTLTAESIFESIINSAERLLEFSKIGVCTYDESKGNWYIVKSFSRNDSKIKTPYKVIELEDSLISDAILQARTVYTSNLDIKTIRISRDEIGLPCGYFAAAPLKSLEHNYGAVFIEANSALNITPNDIDILETLGEHAGTVLEQIRYKSLLEASKIQDANTGSFNTTAFLARLDEEFLRSKDLNDQLVLCLFSIDKYDSFNPEKHLDRFILAQEHVLKRFINHIKNYEFVGSVNEKVFGSVFLGESIEEVKFKVELIRRDIVGIPIATDDRKFHITISAGIAHSNNCNNANDIIDNAMKALQIANQKSNAIISFA